MGGAPLRRMRRRRACSRRHPASGTPGLYGEVTRAARSRAGAAMQFFRPQANDRQAHATFSNHHPTHNMYAAWLLTFARLSLMSKRTLRKSGRGWLSAGVASPPQDGGSTDQSPFAVLSDSRDSLTWFFELQILDSLTTQLARDWTQKALILPAIVEGRLRSRGHFALITPMRASQHHAENLVYHEGFAFPTSGRRGAQRQHARRTGRLRRGAGQYHVTL